MPVISDYLADLLCLPLVLSFCRFVMIWWRIIPNHFELTRSMIFATAAYIAIVFEGLLPHFSSGHESDWLDVVAYFLGAFGYFVFREKIKTRKHEFSEMEH